MVIFEFPTLKLIYKSKWTFAKNSLINFFLLFFIFLMCYVQFSFLRTENGVLWKNTSSKKDFLIAIFFMQTWIEHNESKLFCYLLCS